ncbi:peptidylprolyl isomerase [Hoyosella subflava]|uniref:Peptidylprolyl isomerase n=1 Tax=Hoyosella subflava (strain DSM 45089 / JCM 17490 / NBRC 109087 / DQS3-9A1) TaxID=443218 RepID=F6ELM2_HOYSD|nr:peptidylprolyl isomerase [Hoyosella subflava]AEF40272.1 Peptidylprolyl isomerase [Hoyosella subflava DQS3-9A1]
MKRARRVAAAIVAPALLLAACSGGDSDNADATGVPASPFAEQVPADESVILDAEPFDVSGARTDQLPERVDCTYDRAGNSARPVTLPPTSAVPATGVISARIELREGVVELSLDRAKSPCAVNSFVSLAEQDYFTSTICHRLTTRGIFTLQCGDPTGTGTGGPGYAFANEFPTDQLALDSGEAEVTTVYPRGTVAMRDQGTGNNGSQFFIVYDDSPLPPVYTVFGNVDDGLSLIEDIAAEGTTPEHQGAPRQTVQIMSIQIGS